MRSFARPPPPGAAAAAAAADPLLLALLPLLPLLPWLPTLSLASVFSVTGSVAGCNDKNAVIRSVGRSVCTELYFMHV